MVSPITESELIDQIAQRYAELMGYDQSEMLRVSRDIMSWHESVFRLDLEKLLHADDLTLIDDVVGIRMNLYICPAEDEDDFIPLCAAVAGNHGEA